MLRYRNSMIGLIFNLSVEASRAMSTAVATATHWVFDLAGALDARFVDFHEGKSRIPGQKALERWRWPQ